MAEEPFVMSTKAMGDFRWETAREYLTYFVIPTVHFHTSTAYCILRAQGVPVGVMDYFGDVLKRAQ
ncbi:hypothetical protein BJ170DRAFT_624333 [Xylariales sp. AK1849]|nr:hypothetical protein BJ170DRAFT_624333 [Xylariales sp. AK1849]